MKSKTIISTCWFFVLAIMILAAACTKDRLTGEEPGMPDVPEGMVRMELHTNAGEYQVPVSRAADENDVLGSMPWVFVFRGNNDNAVFAEVKQAVPGGTGNIPYVMLTEQSSAVRLLIIANAPPAYFDGTTDNILFTETNLTSTLTTGGAKTLAEASLLLNTAKLASVQTTVPYDGGYLPMSGIHDMAGGITSSTVSIGATGSEVILTRVPAKATVENTAATFRLMSATVAEVKQYGRLYQPSPISYIADNLVNYAADIVSAISESTVANPIYIYESASGKSSVIVRGTYNGTLYYYRLAFKNRLDNSIMNIDRNKWYKFHITAVRGEGFSTFDEALAAPPSNNLIEYTITVIDLNSHDMMDNGLYYMGVSDSEVLFYGLPPAAEQLTAAIVTTNASSAMLAGINSVTVSGAGLTLVSPGSLPNLSADGIAPAANDIRVSVSAAFISGEITVKLGNLTKTIRLIRVSADLLSFVGIAQQMNYHTGNQYSSATIDDPASSWLSLSTDGSTSVGNEFTQADAGNFLPVYLLPEKNVGVSGISPRSTAGIYLTRRDAGRVKVFVRQNALNTSTITLTPIPNGYVGTFHRCDETGERVIRMNNTGNTAWAAMVIAGDFIILDTETLGRTNTNDNTALTGDAETHKINGKATRVSGRGNRIYFRVGLTGNLPGGSADAAPRYGLILVSYNNNTQYCLIYVRQGEAADYLMRNIAEDNPTGTTALTDLPRKLAGKFTPYNLTDPNGGTGRVGTATGTKYSFTKYPSQGGYFFQWYQTYAWSPVGAATTNWLSTNSSTALWEPSKNLWETCPAGYRRPNDGNTSSHVVSTDGNSNVSEVRQSLFLNPQDGDRTSNLDNLVWGYLADGFFDRGTITAPQGTNPAANSAVDPGTVNVAYAGQLFYNPNNNASVFFPATGYRISSSGQLSSAGSNVSFWSSKSRSATNAYFMYSNSSTAYLYQNFRYFGFSIRCVKE